MQVFVLAGDSNMGGRATVDLLEYQAQQPETRARFAPWKDGDDWVVRDDVWIKYGSRIGNLTVGYGNRGAERFGPELEFWSYCR